MSLARGDFRVQSPSAKTRTTSGPDAPARDVDKFDRIFALHEIFSSRRTAIDQEELLARLECRRSTLHRLMAEMKTMLGAPIIFDASQGGWRYARATEADAYELPGLWLSASELQALAVIQRLLRDLGGGLLEEKFAPLARRIDQLMKNRRLNLEEAAVRLRFPALGARPPGSSFQIVASATLQRKKLWFQYRARTRDEVTDRRVSPQRLTHYRESWYLDAWDEERDSLRTFAVDRTTRPTVLNERAYDAPEQELDEHLATAYGIFGGKADKIAVLRFTREAARWVADEQWHPQQAGEYLDDGSYELRIPYRESRELVMDVLRHGPDVEVVEPESLRTQVAERLTTAAGRYKA